MKVEAMFCSGRAGRMIGIPRLKPLLGIYFHEGLRLVFVYNFLVLDS